MRGHQLGWGTPPADVLGSSGRYVDATELGRWMRTRQHLHTWPADPYELADRLQRVLPLMAKGWTLGECWARACNMAGQARRRNAHDTGATRTDAESR